MIPRVAAKDWLPQGEITLEPTALLVATSTMSASVVAGPGAGKTELLAQRACYLLQTRTCPSPKRILALSFKRDAARTLNDRVALRAGDLSHRFESYTFDGFAKGLVDRFFACIPLYRRPPRDYSIVPWTKREVEDFLRTLRPPPSLGSTYDLAALKGDGFMRDAIVGVRLSAIPVAAVSVVEWAANELWDYSIAQGRLTFPMLGRLAGLILLSNPQVCNALRQTYAFVLLDEFQDTTHVQYDLAHIAFHGSTAALTVVGDHKQRIMGWAMALDDAFAQFEHDFAAHRQALLMNYRSAPELVRIQEFMIKALDPEGVQPRTPEHLKNAKGSAELLVFPDHETEARFVADEIKKFLTDEGVGPRDICVLTKQKPDIYAEALQETLAALGMRARIENDYQDLLAESATDLVLAYLQLAVAARAPRAWTLAIEFAYAVEGLDSHTRSGRQVERTVTTNIGKIKKMVAKYPNSEEEVRAVIDGVVRLIDSTALRQHYIQYRRGTLLDDTIWQLGGLLWKSVSTENNWAAALSDFCGIDAVPVMTIHKSKGLEYHTIVFLGLEDSAFWSFATQAHDDTCAFFVAFSRAKNRVLFTFSKQRTTSPRHQDHPQAAKGIRPLYDILKAAGVKVRRIDAWPAPLTDA